MALTWAPTADNLSVNVFEITLICIECRPIGQLRKTGDLPGTAHQPLTDQHAVSTAQGWRR